MSQLQEYIKQMPRLYDRVIEVVHIPPTHPMYEKYVNDAVWKYMYGDEKVNQLSAYINVDGLKVLDIGAGVGGLSAAFAKKGASVTAIDVDDGYQMLSKIGYEECGVEVESKIFDGGKFPFPDETFDIVCCFNIFEHVPNLERLFREMQRVLKPGGIVIGRADYKYSWSNIKADPHYGLPLNILMPKWFRKWMVVDVTKRNYELDDIVWAKNFNDIKQRFDKVGMEAHSWNDDFISIKTPKTLEHAIGVIDIQVNRECFNEFHNPEIWGEDSVIWSKERSTFKVLPITSINEVSFEIFSLEEKNVRLNENVVKTLPSQWISVKLTCNGIINISTKPSKVSGDPRNLGIAIKNIRLM